MKASAPFNESLKEMLKAPELAAMYLEESLQDGSGEEFKQALKQVTEVRQRLDKAENGGTFISHDEAMRRIESKIAVQHNASLCCSEERARR